MIQDFGFGFFLRGTVNFPKAYQAVKKLTPLQKGTLSLGDRLADV